MIRANAWKVLIAGAVAAACMLAPAMASANGSVSRYQTETLAIHANFYGAGTPHDFTVTLNPCDGTFTGTGIVNWEGDHELESITGSYANGTISWTATYLPGSERPGWVWQLDPTSVARDGSFSGIGAITYPFSLPGQTVSGTVRVTSTSSYANHGAYVSANPGADAAHSCIGMPIQSQK